MSDEFINLDESYFQHRMTVEGMDNLLDALEKIIQISIQSTKETALRAIEQERLKHIEEVLERCERAIERGKQATETLSAVMLACQGCIDLAPVTTEEVRSLADDIVRMIQERMR
jgi:hypothetical protein